MEQDRSYFKVLTGKPTWKNLQEYLSVDDRTILELS